MEGKYFLKQFFAGLFFVSCLSIIVGAIFIIGVEKGLTQPKFEMSALFRKVGGLMEGAPVRLSGVTVGTVSNISFLDDEIAGRGVKVNLNIFKKFEKQLYKSVRVAIITEGVLGEKIVEITTAPQFQREDLTRPIIGEDPLDVQNLAETFGEAAVALLETSKQIDVLTNELKFIAGNVKRLMNRVEQRVIEGTLFKVF